MQQHDGIAFSHLHVRHLTAKDLAPLLLVRKCRGYHDRFSKAEAASLRAGSAKSLIKLDVLLSRGTRSVLTSKCHTMSKTCCCRPPSLERAWERSWKWRATSADRVLLLGPLQVIQNGSPLPQPPSRKVRALLAYLAMAGRPISREKLCELLWDVADDPRSELRWCLSKLRPLVDGPTTKRLFADRKQVGIEAASLDVDALSVARHTQTTLKSGSPGDLRSLLDLFRGHFLEGLSVERAPSFENWLAGQRHRFDQLRQQFLERLSSYCHLKRDRIEVLRELIEVAPFDEMAHIALVRSLIRRGLYAEARQQIDVSVKRFQSEGIDPSSLRSAFAEIQQWHAKPASIESAKLERRCLRPSEVVRTRRPTLLLMPFTADARRSHRRRQRHERHYFWHCQATKRQHHCSRHGTRCAVNRRRPPPPA